MFAQGSLLSRRPLSDTEFTTLYTAHLPTEITRIMVCNVSSDTKAFSMYQNTPTTSDDYTLFRGAEIPADGTWAFEINTVGGGIFMIPGDTLGIVAAEANTLVVFIYGVIINLAPGAV